MRGVERGFLGGVSRRVLWRLVWVGGGGDVVGVMAFSFFSVVFFSWRAVGGHL